MSVGPDFVQPLVSFHGVRQQETDHYPTAGGIVPCHRCLLYEHVMKNSFIKSREERSEHLRVKGEPINVDA